MHRFPYTPLRVSSSYHYHQGNQPHHQQKQTRTGHPGNQAPGHDTQANAPHTHKNNTAKIYIILPGRSLVSPDKTANFHFLNPGGHYSPGIFYHQHYTAREDLNLSDSLLPRLGGIFVIILKTPREDTTLSGSLLLSKGGIIVGVRSVGGLWGRFCIAKMHPLWIIVNYKDQNIKNKQKKIRN